jgi:hypothetical protein
LWTVAGWSACGSTTSTPVRSVAWLFAGGPPDKALRETIERTRAYIRDDLGDARSFSLDSPKSRAPRIAALRSGS